jgi:hypothetical protein
MDKKIAGLLGAAVALTATTAAQATASSAPAISRVANYAELLNPIPNAVAALKADDARLTQVAETIVIQRRNHHYHHHHHHHHHHHGAFIGVPSVGGVRIGH